MRTIALGQPENAGQACRSIRFTLIDFEESLRALAPAWSALLARSNTNEPMLSPDWLLPWWEIYGRGTGRQLRVGAWFDHDRLIGLALLQTRTYRYRKLLPFRRLEWIGAKVDENDDVCSEYLNLLVEPGAESLLTTAFAGALHAGQFGAWDDLVLDALDDGHPLVGMLADALTATGALPQKEVVTSAPYIPLPETWAEYVQSLGKHKRVVVKSQRDFDHWAQGTMRIHRADSPDSLPEGMRILKALHAERWHEEGTPGAFHAPRFARFHDQVAPALLARGALQLLWLTVSGQPVGAQYSIIWNGKIYFYQSGRRMQLPQNVRVGIVLHAAAIRAAIAGGYREYDFLGGESQYKSQLASARRTLVRLRMVRSVAREKLRLALENAVALVRPLRSWFFTPQR